MIHLICGPTGAGKTTYSRQLAQDRQAIRFSIDEWMANLFSPDLQALPSVAWMTERLERCDVQIWELCKQILSQNQEAILDLGLMQQSQRHKFRMLALAAQSPTTLHYLTASEQIRRQRVKARNREKKETYSFEVTELMFNFAEGWFEPPTEAELRGAIVIDTEHPDR